jgi:hypothetical protein
MVGLVRKDMMSQDPRKGKASSAAFGAEEASLAGSSALVFNSQNSERRMVDKHFVAILPCTTNATGSSSTPEEAVCHLGSRHPRRNTDRN